MASLHQHQREKKKRQKKKIMDLFYLVVDESRKDENNSSRKGAATWEGKSAFSLETTELETIVGWRQPIHCWVIRGAAFPWQTIGPWHPRLEGMRGEQLTAGAIHRVRLLEVPWILWAWVPGSVRSFKFPYLMNTLYPIISLYKTNRLTVVDHNSRDGQAHPLVQFRASFLEW